MQLLHERLSALAEHFDTSGPDQDDLQKGGDRANLAGLLRKAAAVVKVHETAHLRSTFPLHERMKGTIAALRANYSKSAAQAALADLEAALPLITAQTEPGEMQHVAALRVPHAQAAVEATTARAAFERAWTFMQEHLLDEMAAGEPEGRAALDELDAWLDDTKRILAAVEPPGRRAGIVDIWDPFACSWNATPAAPVLMLHERLPNDMVALALNSYQALFDLQPFQVALRLLGFGDEHCTSADPIDYVRRWLDARAQEEHSRVALTSALAAWHAGALELIESRLLAASKPNVRDALRAAVRGEEDLACFWGAVREGLQTRTWTLPPDLVTRAAEVAHALEQGNADVSLMPIDEEAEIYGEKTVVQTAVKVLREIIAAVEAPADTTLETRFTEVHYAVDGAGGPRTVFRFEGLPDVSVPDPDADKLVAQHIRESGLKSKVAAAICNNSNYPPAAQVHILGRNLTRLIDAVFGALGVVPVTVGVDLGRGDEAMVTIVDVETGERRVTWRAGDRCTINGEGSTVFTLRELRADVAMPVDPSGQPNGWKSYEQMHKVTADPLAERARAAAAALRKLGLGEPASTVVAEAADVLSEAGEALRGEASNLYWLVDEYNDTEGETFGIAVRASREVDRALLNWATSYEAMLAAEHGMTPNPVVIGRKLTNGGDALTFLKGLTSADLEAIENGSDNDYGARVRIISAEGTKVLLDAINDTPPGGSLSLYKGTLSTCMPELEDAEQPVPEPTELADLWAYEEKGAWVDDEDSQGPDDADDLEASFDAIDQLGTEAAGAPVPDLPGTLEAVYHQQGWSLVAAPDGRATHLFRRDGEVGMMFVGPAACGIDVAGEVVKPLSERFDYPPHPELCGRCCAGANDQR